ncbi:MAG: PEP-CTERM sorting domain-containing protein [Sphingomonadales bacterium]
MVGFIKHIKRDVSVGIAKGISALFCAALISVSGPAEAVKKAGIEFSPGSILEIGTIWENIVVLPGDILFGVGIVDAVKDGSGAVIFWQNGDNGRELTFEFGGFLVERITLAGTVAVVEFSGGFADLFSDPLQDFSGGASGGGIPGDIASATNGTPFVNLLGAGTGTVCDATCFSGAGPAITLVSTIFLAVAGDLSTVSSGTGSGFFDVDIFGPGVANTNFDTNGQPSGQDFLLGSSFATIPVSNFPLGGSVDLRGAAIPEPTAMALFGFGLIGLGMLAHRRRRRS